MRIGKVIGVLTMMQTCSIVAASETGTGIPVDSSAGDRSQEQVDNRYPVNWDEVRALIENWFVPETETEGD